MLHSKIELFIFYRWYPERFTVRWSSNHDLDNPSSDQKIIQVAETKKFELFHFEVSTAIPTNDIAFLTVRKMHWMNMFLLSSLFSFQNLSTLLL